MLHHSFGGAVIFLSLQHFIVPALHLFFCLSSQLEINACLHSRHRREAIRAVVPFNKLWLLFDRRAKLDSRFTNGIVKDAQISILCQIFIEQSHTSVDWLLIFSLPIERYFWQLKTNVSMVCVFRNVSCFL